MKNLKPFLSLLDCSYIFSSSSSSSLSSLLSLSLSACCSFLSSFVFSVFRSCYFFHSEADGSSSLASLVTHKKKVKQNFILYKITPLLGKNYNKQESPNTKKFSKEKETQKNFLFPLKVFFQKGFFQEQNFSSKNSVPEDFFLKDLISEKLISIDSISKKSISKSFNLKKSTSEDSHLEDYTIENSSSEKSSLEGALQKVFSSKREELRAYYHCELLSQKLEIADTFFKRAKGLLGLPCMEEEQVLYFPQTQAIHTVGMQFPIDCVFVNRKKEIIKIASNVKPFRFVGVYSLDRGIGVFEGPSGMVQRFHLKVGDLLYVDS
jgi:uncharacterized protein